VLTDQMAVYFRETKFGKARASRIVPEPLFAHSELTTGVQVADLAAYVLSWNVPATWDGQTRATGAGPAWAEASSPTADLPSEWAHVSMLRVAVSAPLNGIVEIAGPQQFRFDEFMRLGLRARQDPRVVVADPHARYFGTELAERTLVPGADARLGEIRFEDWLTQSAVHAMTT
jgi:hypothetical protein